MADDNFDYWFPWYPARFKRKTMHLTRLQRTIYRDLLEFYMESRRPLPDSDVAMARICELSPEEFAPHAEVIRAFFKPKKEGKTPLLFHPVCDGLLRDQDERSEKRKKNSSKAGKISAEKRKQKQKQSNDSLNNRSTDVQRNSTTGQDRTGQDSTGKKESHTPLPSRSSAPSTPPEPPEDRARVFSEFFEARPGRGSGADPEDEARREFDQLADGGEDPDKLVSAMRAYAASCRMQEPPTSGTRYAKSAARFLRDGVWRQYAEAKAVDQPAPVLPLPEWQATLVRHANEADVRGFLRNARLDGKRVIVPSKFIAQQVQQRLDHALRMVLGKDFEIVVEQRGKA